MSCPNPGAQLGNACCTWQTFFDGFYVQYKEWMGVDPSEAVWKAATIDWKKANTGWEAAHNARRIAREAVEKANQKPLVWLGGKNYAEAGSALAIKFGKSGRNKEQGDGGGV